MSDFKHKALNKLILGASVDRISDCEQRIQLFNHYEVECIGPNGELKWKDDIYNLVTNAGLNDLLDKYLKGSSYTAAFYVGLVDGSTSPIPSYAAGDTMASHAGWTEEQSYSESVRQTLTLGTVASQSVDNSASKASFSINANSQVIAGAFIVTDNTKGGTSGILYGVGNFSGGNKNADNGDTLNVTCTLTAASA